VAQVRGVNLSVHSVSDQSAQSVQAPNTAQGIPFPEWEANLQLRAREMARSGCDQNSKSVNPAASRDSYVRLLVPVAER
jgi:hypothetical protein